MATVKGDVHDIGKNIVGVVLQCNNFEVIDLGVMVACDEILRVAREEKVDIIGLSGLITPSLDEMVSRGQRDAAAGVQCTADDRRCDHVQGPYSGQNRASLHRNDMVVYVPDASRSVSVATQLMGDDKAEFVASEADEYKAVQGAGRQPPAAQQPISLRGGRRAAPDSWTGQTYAAAPPVIHRHRVFEDFPLEKLVDTIDWTPFFITWELAGKFPAILDDRSGRCTGQRAVTRMLGPC